MRLLLRDRVPRPGAQHTETYRTFAEAREAKRTRGSQVATGEFSPLTKVGLHEYARELNERYQGTGRRGFGDETRSRVHAHLEKYALRWFPPQTKLAEIDPRTVADFIAWLVKQPNRSKGTLADSSVHNAFKPLAA